MMLKLFHANKLIGEITNAMPDELANVGDISLTSDAAAYKALFEFFNDDHNRWTGEPPFPKELLTDWWIEDEKGQRQDIDVPVINDNKEIWWR